MEIHAMFIHFLLCFEACYGLLNLMLLCLLLVYCLKGIRNTYVKKTPDNSCCPIQRSIRTSGFTGRIPPGCVMDPKVLELFLWTGARRFGRFLAPTPLPVRFLLDAQAFLVGIHGSHPSS